MRPHVGYSLSRVDYFCSHDKQKKLPPAVPEAIAFIAAGITMNNIAHLPCTSLWLTMVMKGIKLRSSLYTITYSTLCLFHCQLLSFPSHLRDE